MRQLKVERVIRNHSGIDNIAVVGFSDETWGEVGYAFVIPKPGRDLKAEEVIRFCEGKLAHYKWPKHVIFKDEFPRTALGKVRKTALKHDYLAKDTN